MGRKPRVGPLPIPESKTCYICKEHKPVSQFYIKWNNWVGSYCKPCDQAYQKEIRQKRKNKLQDSKVSRAASDKLNNQEDV